MDRQTIQTTRRQLGRLYKQLAKSKPSTNKDGTGKSQRLAAAIAAQEAELKRLGTEKAQLPERIDIQGLTR